MLACAVLLAPAFLYPNVFGNQPDALADESYFLTSALQSIRKHTLPGWEFSASGAYYGGVQAYIDTVVLAPVVAGEMVLTRSLGKAELWIALNTGTLLYILRVVNGFLFLSALAGVAYYLMRRRAPRPLMRQVGFLGLLMLGNSLAVMLAHTAKVWVLYMVIELIAGILVLAQEQYRAQDEEFVRTSRYVGALLWLAVLAFFQTFVGVISTGLWLLWAWWLGHFALTDVWQYVRRWWYLFILTAATQVSFMWRAFFAREHGSSLLDYGGFTGEHSVILWPHRFLAPLHDAVLAQPFILLYPLCAALLFLPSYRRLLGRSKRYLAVALLHPIVIYLFFYPLLGFDTATRYGVILALACSFSAVMLLPLRGSFYNAAALGAGALALAVLLHATALYWQPSYQAQLVASLRARYNEPTNVFIVDKSAIGLQLPVNTASLEQLDSTGASMSRNAYLLAHLSAVGAQSSFTPLVLYARSDAEYQAYLAAQLKLYKNVFHIYFQPGAVNTAEPSTLPEFFAAARVGSPYVVERAVP